MKALVVDDMIIIVLVMRKMLETLGYEVDSALDGEQGVQLFKEGHYDVVIMDHHMPNMTGIEATTEIRKLEMLEKRPHVVILAATSHPNAEILADWAQAGATMFLEKPISHPALIQALKDAKAKKPARVSDGPDT